MKTSLLNLKIPVISMLLLLVFLTVGCGRQSDSAMEAVEPAAVQSVPSTPVAENEPTAVPQAVLSDGVYSADFTTDSSMFRVNEANNGKGTLTVADGKMTIHVCLASKKILNLFPGTAEEANQEGATLLNPTVDIVTYSDGATDEVYAFDIPVPALDEAFPLALVGTKGIWYDHMVSVSNPLPADVPAQ